MQRAVVLLSGGLDSATTLALALREGYECHALTVRYGQKHAQELAFARELAGALGSSSQLVVDADLSFAGSALTDPRQSVPKDRSAEELCAGIPATYVPARNTVLLALGLCYAETLGARDLFLGVNAIDYSGYPDCRPEFILAFEQLANLGTRAGTEGGRFRVHAPLIRMTKAEIIRTAISLGVRLERTLSCYDPGAGGVPCGGCDACRIRARGFLEAGLPDPALPGR